jgi:predicted ATPase
MGSSSRPLKFAVSGTACQGKTTLIADIKEQWPKFILPEKTYRDVIKEKGLVINKVGNKESQKAILDFMVEQTKKNYGNNVVLFDRCPLDNLIYTLWLYDKGLSDIDDEFVKYTIEQVKDSMRYMDAIFFIPLTKQHTVPIVPDKLREIDPVYIEEIDHLFKAAYQDWKQGAGGIFKKDDAPAIIEIFGPRDVRMQMMRMYINENGSLYGEKDSLIATI